MRFNANSIKLYLYISPLKISLLFTLVFTTFVYSQNFKHYNNYNGLVNNHIKGIQMDSMGYTWIGTENGLVRFDGTLFKNYDLSEILNDKSNENRVVCLLPPQNGWVIGFVQERGVFKACGNAVMPLLNFDLKTLDPNIPASDLRYESHFHENVFKLMLNVKQNDFIKYYENNQLHLFLNGQSKGTLKLPVHNNDKNVGLHNLTHKNRFFYMHKFNSCYEWVEGKWIMRNIIGLDLKNNDQELAYHTFNNLNSDQRFLMVNKKFYRMRYNETSNEWHAELLIENMIDNQELSFIFHEENMHLLYIGTLNNGFYIYFESPSKNTFRLIKTTSTRGFLQFDKDHLLDTKGQFCNIYNGKISDYKYPFVLVSNYIKDHHDQIWINTENLFISKRVRPLKPVKIEYKPKKIKTLLEDNKGRIWLFYNDGILVIDNSIPGGNGKVLKELKDITNVNAYDCELLNEIVLNSADSKVFIINTNDFTFKSFSYDKACSRARSIKKIAKDLYLVITYGNGMFLLGPNKTSALPVDLNGSLKYAHEAIEYKKGKLLISTNNGCVAVSVNDLMKFWNDSKNTPYYTLLGEEMNMPSLECNGGFHSCLQWLSNGMIAASGVDGFTIIDPETIEFYNRTVQILIESVVIDGAQYDGDKLNIQCQSANPYIQINYSVPYYQSRFNILLEYNIDNSPVGFQKLDYKSGNKFDLFGLGSGRHQVLLRLRQGNNNYTYKNISIDIPEYWFKEWQAVIVFLVILVLIVFGFFYLRNNYLASQNKQLMAMVDDRTKKLSENLLEIDSKKRELEKTLLFKNRIMSVISHDVLGPLRFAAKITKDISKKQTKPVDKEMLNSIGQTIDRMLVMSFDILTWAKSQSDNFTPLQVEIYLFEVIERIFTLHEENANLKYQKMVNAVDDELILFSDPNVLSAVLNNLIENAVKHGHTGEIKVSCYSDENVCRIEVENKGPSFEKDLLRAINQRNSNMIFELASKNSKGGHGLRICFELLMMINAHLYIRASNGTNIVGIELNKTKLQ